MRAMTTRIKRRIVQLVSVLGLNWYLFIPWLGNYTRGFCAPALNCWTCPAAAFSCPMGAMGTSMGSHVFPFFVLGLLLLFGSLAGRFWCGWVCPFGTLQDYAYKIPTYKLRIPHFVTYARYVFLVGGEAFAIKEMLPPAVAMWSANVIIGGLGLVLTATTVRR